LVPNKVSKPKSVPEMGYGVESWWMYFVFVPTTLSMASGCFLIETPKVASKYLHTTFTHKENFK
jgi:hypothetical protein